MCKKWLQSLKIYDDFTNNNKIKLLLFVYNINMIQMLKFYAQL